MLKKILYLLTFILLIGAGVAFWAYDTIYAPNVFFDEDKMHIQIPRTSSFDDVVILLKKKQLLNDYSSFERVAGWMNYDRMKVPSGNFEIRKGWSNKMLISKLRSGIQTPKSITFNNVRTIEELAGPLSEDIALDSSEIVAYFKDSVVLKKIGFNKENILSMFIPNTYQIFWDVTLEGLAAKMKNEHDAFWDKDNRKNKAAALGMSPSEVYSLASVVEKESQYGPERPIIAGLYLNRLERGIHLQADPTVVFANGDFSLRRVLNKHLAFDSPYNTYKYPGLPPGPIYMPSIESIDAVLNPEKHEYLYMCAKPGFGTQHAFAKTLRGHNRNANEYRNWLNQQGIR